MASETQPLKLLEGLVSDFFSSIFLLVIAPILFFTGK